MGEKFSVITFVDQYRSTTSRTGDKGLPSLSAEEEHPAWFVELVDEIRGELTLPRGRSEEERQAYTDTLNRAVIGYEAERRYLHALVQDLLAKRRIHRPQPGGMRFANLAEAVFAEIVGWNVLEALLQNRGSLEEIQVVGERIFEVRGGKAAVSPYKFRSLKEVERLQQNLVLFNSDTLNLRKRWAEVMLLDGSRVTITGYGFTSVPTLTIRFYSSSVFELEALAGLHYGTLSPKLARILQILLRSRYNLLVTGPTNSGKTSLIKALIRELPDEERLVTIESRCELMIKRDFPLKNVIEYEIDEEDAKHDGAQAFKLALRQSPKRIIHAEIRDDDANIYVRACTRGHEGSVTTVHVSALEDAPEAITDMCMMDGRGMDPSRLIRRITEFVTQIGLEMSIVEGQRKLVRLGEFEFRDGRVTVRDWVRYDYAKGGWKYPLSLSDRARERLAIHDPEGFDEMKAWLEGKEAEHE